MKLELSIFKFDAKSDYLPYYTKHFLTIKDEKNLLDILNTICKENLFSFSNSINSSVVVNGLYTTLALSIEEIKNSFGNYLEIEPLSIRRAYKDLLINEDDFYGKLSLLKDFDLSSEQKSRYEKYKIYFYASNTLNINKNYIGDAFILLSYYLIEDEKYKNEIIKILKDETNGAMFHTNLSSRVFNFDFKIEEKIKDVQKKLGILKDISKQNFKSKNAKSIYFGDTCEIENVKYSFKDFNLAIYKNTSKIDGLELAKKLEAKFLDIPSLKDDLSLDTFHINPNFTFKLATKILLDVFDSGADLLIVDTKELFELFDSNNKEFKKISNREIDLPILHINELVKLVNGNLESAKETLKLHLIDPKVI